MKIKLSSDNSERIPTITEEQILAPLVTMAGLSLPASFLYRYIVGRQRTTDLEKMLARYGEVPTHEDLPRMVFQDEEIDQLKSELGIDKMAREDKVAFMDKFKDKLPEGEGDTGWFSKIFPFMTSQALKSDPQVFLPTLFVLSSIAGTALGGYGGKKLADRMLGGPLQRKEQDSLESYERALSTHRILNEKMRQKTSSENYKPLDSGGLKKEAGVLWPLLIGGGIIGSGVLQRQAGPEIRNILTAMAIPAALTGFMIGKGRARKGDSERDKYNLAKRKIQKGQLGQPIYVDIDSEPMMLEEGERDDLIRDLEDLGYA